MQPPIVTEVFVRFFGRRATQESTERLSDVAVFWKSRTYEDQFAPNRLRQPPKLDSMRALAISLLVDTAGVAARQCRSADQNRFDLIRCFIVHRIGFATSHEAVQIDGSESGTLAASVSFHHAGTCRVGFILAWGAR